MLRLKEIRNSRGCSQEKLAKLLNVSRSTVAMWETGNSEPNYETLKKIGEYFNVSTDYILGKESKASDMSEARKNCKRLCEEQNTDIVELERCLGVSYTTFKAWVNGYGDFFNDKLSLLADFFNVSADYLLGRTDGKTNFEPGITDDYTTFPVLGEIAAGYDSVPLEQWDGEKIDIPNSYLKGHDKSEFFVLKVKGDSMFPEYRENDKVLILKQETMDYSGQVGAVIYDSDFATLKKIEYKMGEDWMRLVPINPTLPTVTIKDSDLELCRVIGIPRLLIREIED